MMLTNVSLLHEIFYSAENIQKTFLIPNCNIENRTANIQTFKRHYMARSWDRNVTLNAVWHEYSLGVPWKLMSVFCSHQPEAWFV